MNTNLFELWPVWVVGGAVALAIVFAAFSVRNAVSARRTHKVALGFAALMTTGVIVGGLVALVESPATSSGAAALAAARQARNEARAVAQRDVAPTGVDVRTHLDDGANGSLHQRSNHS